MSFLFRETITEPDPILTYSQFLKDTKDRFNAAQIDFAHHNNNRLVIFYWEFGKELVAAEKILNLDNYFIQQLSRDLLLTFPGMHTLTKTNLEDIRKLAILYPGSDFPQQTVAQLPWGHLILLINNYHNPRIREWYAKKTILNGWSRAALATQIRHTIYDFHGLSDKTVNNYHGQRPDPHSDLARELLTDLYTFDFLTIHEKLQKNNIENFLLTHMRDYLIELEEGFAFVGMKVPLRFNDQDLFIDLLFYNLTLRCYMIVQRDQLNHHINAVDNLLKKEIDNPTIGILLRQPQDKIEAEYIFPTEPTHEMKTNLPSIWEIDRGLNRKLGKKFID